MSRCSLFLAGALALGACATETPEADDTDEAVDSAEMPVLARYALPGGGELEVFEPSPGDFILGQRLPADAPAPALADTFGSLPEVYARYFPGQPLPETLRAAETRRLAFEAESAVLAPLQRASRSLRRAHVEHDAARSARAAAESPRNVQEFKDRHCLGTNASYVDFSYCWPESSNTATVYEDDVNGVYTAARPYRGDVTFRLRYRPWWDWETQFSRNVDQGETYRAVHSNSSRDFDVETKVYNADGNGFNMSTFGTKHDNGAGCYEDLDYAGCTVHP
jgi:hypothetical protein